jgi:hypothetical protein
MEIKMYRPSHRKNALEIETNRASERRYRPSERKYALEIERNRPSEGKDALEFITNKKEKRWQFLDVV